MATRTSKTRTKAKRQPKTFSITLDGDHLDALDALADAQPPIFPYGVNTRSARVRFCIRNFGACLARLREAMAAEEANAQRLEPFHRLVGALVDAKAAIDDSPSALAPKQTLEWNADRFE